MFLRSSPRTMLLLGSLVIATAHADEVVVTPTKDNSIFSADIANSNGIGDGVFCGRTGAHGSSTLQRSLLAFDVASHVPAGSTITGATLTLTLLNSVSEEQTHTLHVLLADWGEGTSNAPGGGGAPATSGDATWLFRFFATDVWNDLGGDFTETVTASAEVGLEPGPITWGPTAEMTADVQGWLDDPATNFGWIMRGNEKDTHTAKKFASKDHEDKLIHPALVIEFTTSSCPEDLDGSGDVGFQDILRVISGWGPCEGCPEDLDGSGDVGFGDLLRILGAWGPCE